ncbi:MAG: hypothetical protein ABS934_03770 [Psychrobacillus sp.]
MEKKHGSWGGKMERAVYIVLTDSGTWFSKVIGLYTGKNKNHASIAFDEKLKEMYSFGRKRRYNPINGGFVQEDARVGLLSNANCSIFEYKVSLSEYKRMRDKVLTFKASQDRYKYNLLGLIAIALRFNVQRENAYFCSQFVATILNESSIDIETPSQIQPHHFAEYPSMQPIYEGRLQFFIEEEMVTLIGKECIL